MLVRLGDVTSILITLILKLTNIRFKTNDQLECVAKLIKIHKAQVGLKGIYQENRKVNEEQYNKDQDTRPSLYKLNL